MLRLNLLLLLLLGERVQRAFQREEDVLVTLLDKARTPELSDCSREPPKRIPLPPAELLAARAAARKTLLRLLIRPMTSVVVVIRVSDGLHR